LNHTPKQRILAAAANEFATNGYEGARVDAIAAEAGVNKASLYYHVGSKEDLYSAVLLDFFGVMAKNISDSDDANATPEQRLRFFVTAVARKIGASPVIPPILLREMAAGGEKLHTVVSDVIATIVGLLRSIVNEGIAQGDFDPSANFIVIHAMAIGGLNFLLQTVNARKMIAAKSGINDPKITISSANEIGQAIADQLLNGLKSRKDTTAL
jgi:AcrR family transcriptional regulator